MSEAKCPVCGKQTALEHKPFCSKRCADVDLHRWLSGAHVIPGPPVTDADEEEP